MEIEFPKSGIYFIVNLINDKIYVGSATSFYSRFATHKSQLNSNSHQNKHLQSAWNKYGANAFDFIVIESVVDLNKLIAIEQLWINATNCCDPNIGYNLCPTAGNSSGFKHSEETKQDLSKQKTGTKLSKERAEFFSTYWIDRKQSDEHIAKRFASRDGWKHTEEAKAKVSKGNSGKTRTKEHVAAIILANRDFKEWPCADGSKCKCPVCRKKRSDYVENWQKQKELNATAGWSQWL